MENPNFHKRRLDHLAGLFEKLQLSDIKEVAMAYSATDIRKKITDRSTMQSKLWEVLNLGDVERRLSLHQQN